IKDKEYEKITSIICPMAESIYTVSLPNKERTLPAEKLAEVVKKHCQKVKADQTIETAVEDARNEAMTKVK
ncbi:bifunctional folylpolyglutamate synthase/dihydrofolate synthase, partial [Mediterraneibacter faecis]|nr:bifunctional folylpolyglutamate synthase/dihydrofolate synthase [Mediterraneibacter faecis]